MVFLSPDMLTIKNADYASLICYQFEFQASETTCKVTGLQPLSNIITRSTNTLSTALTDIPDPTVCNYLFQIIETTTSFSTSTYPLYFSHHFTSYTTNCIKSLFSTLLLLYPILQIADVWGNSSNHPTKETVAELLAHSKSHCWWVKSFNPYDTRHIRPTPIPNTDLPPQRKTKSKRHLRHNNPSPMHTAFTSLPLPSSWTRGSPTLPNSTTNQLCLLSQQQTQQLQTPTTKCWTTFKLRLQQFLFASIQPQLHPNKSTSRKW